MIFKLIYIAYQNFIRSTMETKSLEKIIKLIRLREDASSLPTNNVSSGNIAGTVEAGDDPPVKPRKKYIYMKGVRKTWKPENG